MDYSDMDAVEAADSLSWHDRRQSGLVERRPAPLELTLEDVAKFIAMYCESAIWVQPTTEYPGGWKVDCERASHRPFKAVSLQTAVGMAAAAFKEVNGELKL